MKTKHTPGPWKVLDEAIISDQLNKFGNFYIAGVPPRHEHAVNEPKLKEILAENKANANLIAAAPDMLEALVAIESCLLPSDNDYASKKIRAAIAKARGEIL